MTTIAYRKDSGELAGDRLFDVGGSPVEGTKIMQFGNLSCAGSGGWDNVQRFFAWVKAGRPEDKKPVMEEKLGFRGLIIENGEIYRYEEGLFPLKMSNAFWAIGSGSDYALAAMEMGASAKLAVEIAAKFDLYTGIGVDVLRVPVNQ